eukprot:360708-Chlamydomonas_euryale.AAC.2
MATTALHARGSLKIAHNVHLAPCHHHHHHHCQALTAVPCIVLEVCPDTRPAMHRAGTPAALRSAA